MRRLAILSLIIVSALISIKVAVSAYDSVKAITDNRASIYSALEEKEQ